MKGPGILTMLMFVTLAVYAYAEASPRPGHREASSLFSRKAAKTSCLPGFHYSNYHNECVRNWAALKD